MPRPGALLPALATSLNDLSKRLAALGRQERALNAIVQADGVRRRLTQATPDAFIPRLASSLRNLSNSLGRREPSVEAMEAAVELYRRVAQVRPDAFLPSLATMLNILSDCLAALGRQMPALATIDEAIAIRREPRGSQNPDVFGEGLQQSLATQQLLTGRY